MSEYIISKTDASRVIIVGDWNLTPNRIDKQGGEPRKATTYRNAVIHLIDERNLTDMYRQLHPSTNSVPYMSKTLKIKSRLDFFLVSRPISFDVFKAEIRTSVAPDHKSVFLRIEIKSESKKDRVCVNSTIPC